MTERQHQTSTWELDRKEAVYYNQLDYRNSGCWLSYHRVNVGVHVGLIILSKGSNNNQTCG